MNAAGAKLVQGLLALLLVLSAGLYIKSLRSSLEAARNDTKAATKVATERADVIRTMAAKQRINEAALKQLANEQADIRVDLANRKATIKKLETENAEMRAWAVGPLPDAVVRLQQHGPVTGAAAYRQRVPAGTAVQPAGGGRGN